MTNAGAAGQAAPAPYYVVFDVDVRDAPRYGEYMAHVLPQIEAAGGVEGLPSPGAAAAATLAPPGTADPWVP